MKQNKIKHCWLASNTHGLKKKEKKNLHLSGRETQDYYYFSRFNTYSPPPHGVVGLSAAGSEDQLRWLTVQRAGNLRGGVKLESL